MNTKKIIQSFRGYKQSINPKYRAYADEVISLFKDRKIEKTKEAEKLLIQLSSRGKAPAAAIQKIKDKYSKAEPATGKLSRPAERSYFIKGRITMRETYTNELKKTGEIKTQFYDLPPTVYTATIKTKNQQEAERLFNVLAIQQAETNQQGNESNKHRVVKVIGVDVDSVVPESSFKAETETSQLMKAAKPLEYSFVPADDSLNTNTGFCVLDQFLGLYSQQIKHLTKEYFIDLCYQVRGESKPAKKEISLLDVGILDIDEEEERPDVWNISKGVSPDMLKKICEFEDISHYCFDVTRKCFLKHISRNRNYKALVYYCINNHMYLVLDPKAAEELVKRARDVETKIKSHCIQEDVKETENIYSREIFEDIPIDNLNNYQTATIIYSKSNLNDELDQVILKHNYIPSLKNHRSNTTQINYNKDGRDIILVIDPNIEHGMTFKDVRQLCNKVKVVFNNQSFTQLIKEELKKYFDAKIERHQPTKEERANLFDKADGCCASCKKKIKVFHVDHIIPLAEGGTNDAVNLQVLCKPCHFDKTRQEQEHGYIKLSQTESSFNSTVREIFNSALNTKYAFVEKLKETIPPKLANNKIHFIDKVRCRKTCLYYNKYDYPLFTVIDEPAFYKGEKKAGLYFVRTNNYLPMRGNGWYSLPMIEYCLSTRIIKETDITHAIYSSLTIPKDHYNKFIDYITSTMDDKAKLAVNSMIGCFKPKVRENWRSLLITTNPNAAYAHFLNKNGCFIDSRKIGDQTYYQVYDRYFSNREETEAPIYNQILEQEAIEVHKLIKIIENKGGVVLDVSTDCVSCVFETNESPFEVENDRIKGYYDDAEQKSHKYRTEDKDGRLEVERMKAYVRSELYYHTEKEFNIIPDSDDFEMLVDLIINSGKSIHIDGRAGCGKTYLMNILRDQLKARGIEFACLAPTNKACRLISGETMHRFAVKATGSFIRETKIKYIFIDEVSMMAEMFYKFFIVLKRMRPDIKFIIAGDFAQLLPVKDRVENCDYKNSLALHELCDGNRLQLTKCRRSDSTLFNMLLPNNIKNVKKSQFKNQFTKLHICFTNKKRIEINKLMMDQVIQKKKVKPLELKALDYDQNSQDVKLCAGMPVISRKNSKDLNIYNNETYTIKEIRHKEKIVIVVDDGKEQEVKFEEFSKMFNVAFCITTHRSQGMTIDEPYTIHEFEKFDNRLKYVALSRSTNINHINII